MPLSKFDTSDDASLLIAGDHVLVSSYDRRVVWFDLDLSSMPYKTLKYHTKVSPPVTAVCSRSDETRASPLAELIFLFPRFLPWYRLSEAYSSTGATHLWPRARMTGRCMCSTAWSTSKFGSRSSWYPRFSNPCAFLFLPFAQ